METYATLQITMKNALIASTVLALGACNDEVPPTPAEFYQDAFIEPDAAPVNLSENCADNPEGFGNFALPVDMQAIADEALHMIRSLRNSDDLVFQTEPGSFLDDIDLTTPGAVRHTSFGRMRLDGLEVDDRRILIGCGLGSSILHRVVGNQLHEGINIGCVGVNIPEDYDVVSLMTEADLNRGTLNDNGVLGFRIDYEPNTDPVRVFEFELTTRFNCGDVETISITPDGVNGGYSVNNSLDLGERGATTEEQVSALAAPLVPFVDRLPYEHDFN